MRAQARRLYCGSLLSFEENFRGLATIFADGSETGASPCCTMTPVRDSYVVSSIRVKTSPSAFVFGAESSSRPPSPVTTSPRAHLSRKTCILNALSLSLSLPQPPQSKAQTLRLVSVSSVLHQASCRPRQDSVLFIVRGADTRQTNHNDPRSWRTDTC